MSNHLLKAYSGKMTFHMKLRSVPLQLWKCLSSSILELTNEFFSVIIALTQKNIFSTISASYAEKNMLFS